MNPRQETVGRLPMRCTGASEGIPAWLGWVGVAGSLVAGVMMFLRSGLVPGRLFIVFALVVSLWMVAMGGLMWRRAGTTPTGRMS